MRLSDYDSSSCSISRAIDVVGDRWTLLILRDMINGIHRYEDLHQHLGIARDVLSRRLTALVGSGVVEKTGYQPKGERKRYEYRLTASGRELQSVLVALMDWGDRHLAGPEGSPMVLEHVDCGSTVHSVLACESGHHVESTDVRLMPQSAALLLI